MRILGLLTFPPLDQLPHAHPLPEVRFEHRLDHGPIPLFHSLRKHQFFVQKSPTPLLIFDHPEGVHPLQDPKVQHAQSPHIRLEA